MRRLLLSASALTLIAACTPSDGTSTSSSSTESSATSVAASSTATSGEVRTVPVTVTNWTFEPTTITAQKDEKVQLALSGDEGIHGFAVPDLGMNVRVAAGETVTVDLPTTKAGTFEIFCSIPCGPGHRDMKATIVIQ